jgi:hypothetical protein
LFFINSGRAGVLFSRKDGNKLMDAGIIEYDDIRNSGNSNSDFEFVVTFYPRIIKNAINVLKKIK